MIYQYSKDVSVDKLLVEISQAGLLAPSLVETVDLDLFIHYAQELNDKTVLDTVVSNHVKQTTAEYLSNYLMNQVFPFVHNLIATFAAENISMGVTQAGKTADILGLFEHKYDIGANHEVSLKSSFDTGSLYVSLAILQYIRDNPNEYSGLSPFVTDARLLSMKNKIEAFLGLPLST
jgi:hypothetical protein